MLDLRQKQGEALCSSLVRLKSGVVDLGKRWGVTWESIYAVTPLIGRICLYLMRLVMGALEPTGIFRLSR